MTLRLSVRAVWSNFEIADMDFWRGEAYTEFFDYLDKHGGFYYEVRVSLLPIHRYYTYRRALRSAGATPLCTASPRRYS